MHLLAGGRALAGREEARRLLGGDLLRPHEDLLPLVERLVLGAEHVGTEAAAAAILRERGERRLGARRRRGRERIVVGAENPLAARDLLLERLERCLQLARPRDEEREGLGVAHARDRHRTNCISSSSTWLPTLMASAEAWNARW